MKKCVDYEVEGVRLRGRPKSWIVVVEKDCWTRQLNDDAVDYSKWRKLIKDIE